MGATSEHFTESELACKCGCGVNACTQALVDALEALRASVGKPITVLSGYRCPTYNAAIGGSRYSQHKLGNAADIRVAGMTSAELEAAAQQIPAFHHGGIGRNDHAGFLHVDVRTHLARWTYDAEGKEAPYYPPV